MFQPMAPLGMALAGALRQPDEQEQPKMSKGQLILGILADALSGAAGRPGQFAQMMNQRKAQEREETNWGRRRQAELEDYEKKQQIEQRYAGPSPMVRDAQAWQTMSPEQRRAYQELQGMKQGDPDVFVTLPNGQVYAGPKSGLAQALMGGAPPQKPVGRLTPISGGPTPPASGGFRSPY
jgi:hypothetical protein